MPHLFGRDWTRAELQARVGDMSQLAAVRRAEWVEGIERGAGLIEVFNASGLCFTVLPGRALDIAFAHYRGLGLCFRGNVGDVGPAFYEPEGDGWLRGFFGGLLTTCGLSFVGHAETDPEEENRELGLHGRLAFLPARNVVAEAQWEGQDYVVRIRGRMREAVVFGTNLEMTREITTVLGEKCLRLHDRVENLGFQRSPLMVVYHTNPGFPLLDEGARLVLSSQRSREWFEELEEEREVGPESYTTVSAPTCGRHDRVIVHDPVADATGHVRVALLNDRLGIGLYWKFPKDELPILNQWQHFEAGTYVTGIEPGNCSVLGRQRNRMAGTLEYLAPGEQREFHLEIGVLDGPEEMAAWESCSPQP